MTIMRLSFCGELFIFCFSMASDRMQTQGATYLASGPSSSNTTRPVIGGYDVEFVSTIPEDYICPICQLVCRDPVQTTECGHRFCESCLEPILRFLLSTCLTHKVTSYNQMFSVLVLSFLSKLYTPTICFVISL